MSLPHVPNFISGRFVECRSGRRFEAINTCHRQAFDTTWRVTAGVASSRMARLADLLEADDLRIGLLASKLAASGATLNP